MQGLGWSAHGMVRVTLEFLMSSILLASFELTT